MLTPRTAGRLGWSWVSTGRTRVGSALPAMGPVPPGLDHHAFDPWCATSRPRAADLPVEHIPPGLPARSPTCTPGLGYLPMRAHRRSRRRSGNARICPVTPVSDRPSGRHPIVRVGPRYLTMSCGARADVDHAPVHRTPGPTLVEAEVLPPGRVRPGGLEPPERAKTRGPHTRPSKRTRPPRRR